MCLQRVVECTLSPFMKKNVIKTVLKVDLGFKKLAFGECLSDFVHWLFLMVSIRWK